MDLEKLKYFLRKNNQPKFRFEQITKAIFQDGLLDFSAMTNLPKNLREELNRKIKILPFVSENILVSKDKKTKKILLKLNDGNFVETVLMSVQPSEWTVCVSSQVGCPMNCAFCATGQGGFKRNLTAEEIVGQVLAWGRPRVNNIVFMGMGEPFLNWENVKESLRILIDKDLCNFGARSISISTVGLPGFSKKLLESFPQVNLAVSLHFASDKKRLQFMPANKSLDLKGLKRELEGYFLASNRKVFLEYILFSGINDSEKDAKELADYIKTFSKKHLLHVNLINYNETGGKFHSVSLEHAQKFKNFLLRQKINCTVRKSLGVDIQGACGQLAGRTS